MIGDGTDRWTCPRCGHTVTWNETPARHTLRRAQALHGRSAACVGRRLYAWRRPEDRLDWAGAGRVNDYEPGDEL